MGSIPGQGMPVSLETVPRKSISENSQMRCMRDRLPRDSAGPVVCGGGAPQSARVRVARPIYHVT